MLAATLVDATIRRLLADRGGTWAHRHRVVGNEGHAWLIVLRLQDGDCALYWDQPNPGGPLLLLLLLKR